MTAVDVAVIGCGVIGLSSALAIQEGLGSKVQVTIFADELSPHTTGDIAAGLWTPYLLEDTPQDKIREWAKVTHDYILDLWKLGFAKDAGISLQPVIKLSNEQSEVPTWSDIPLSFTNFNQSQLDYYSQKYKETFLSGYTYVAFNWEASHFLPYLQRKFEAGGGRVRRAHIKSFDQLAPDYGVIVNCAGLGAAELGDDRALRPVRGQVVRVAAPWQKHVLILDTEFYVIPNRDSVVLGGTHQVGDYNEDIDSEDTEAIMTGCCKYVRALEYAPVVKHGVGLRPGRSCVRLERERREASGRKLEVVHNYGHGGSGITLAMGCALEAAQLVEEALTQTCSKL